MSTARAYGGKRRGRKPKTPPYDTDAWATPQKLFDELNAEFGFAVDAFAAADNAKCPVFVTKDMNAFNVDWGQFPGTKFGNCPYSEVAACLGLAYTQAHKHGETWVMLVKADTSTQWFRKFYPLADEVRFLKRIQFVPPPGYDRKVGSPNMGHAVLVFRGRK